MGDSDLEFIWSDVQPANPKDQAAILDVYVKNGIYTVNEAREILGLPPAGFSQSLFQISNARSPDLACDHTPS